MGFFQTSDERIKANWDFYNKPKQNTVKFATNCLKANSK